MGLFKIEKATFKRGEYTYEMHVDSRGYVVGRYVEGRPLTLTLLRVDGEFGWYTAVDAMVFSSFEEAERWFGENVLGNVEERPERGIEL